MIFVLVHGAWHGGWCWHELVDILRGHGHDVYAPSLTGLADRAHLIDCVNGPDTHVEDIVQLIEWEKLHGITLVGHSYGGTIITGVASRAAPHINRLIYLDAMVPTQSNESPSQLSSPQRNAEIAAATRADGHVDPSGFERWVSPERVDWLKGMTTAQPGGCMGKGVTLTGQEQLVPRRDYIICTRHKPSPFWKFYERYRAHPGWHCHELDCLHDAMIEAPKQLAEILEMPPGR